MDLNSINFIKSGKELEDYFGFDKDLDLYFLFKYSPLCMTSYMIEKNFDAWVENQDSENFSVAKINVIANRDISQKVAERKKVVHESPQLIVFDNDGGIVWYGSHGEINEKKLDEILKTRPHNAV